MGRVFKAHGIRGEVKVIPETDDPTRFEGLHRVFLETTDMKAFTLETVRFQQGKHGVTVVLKIEGVDTREGAEALRHAGVYADRDALPPLAEDEFFFGDLIDLEVVTVEGATVGRVKDVLDLPAQAVLLVRREGLPEVLIPAIPPFLTDVDIERGRVVIQPIEGLLD